MPTPTATDKMIVESGTPFIWPARTIKSGSATLINTPIIKVITMINKSFLLFTVEEPMCFPIGIRETSTPRLNKVIPNIIIIALTKNNIRLHNGMGAMVKPKTKTIIMIGITDKVDSFSFSNNKSSTYTPPLSNAPKVLQVYYAPYLIYLPYGYKPSA